MKKAADAGGANLGLTGQRQRRRKGDDGIDAVHRVGHGGGIADVAGDHLDAVALGVVEGGDVERANVCSTFRQVPHEVDPQEAGTARDQTDDRHDRSLEGIRGRRLMAISSGGGACWAWANAAARRSRPRRARIMRRGAVLPLQAVQPLAIRPAVPELEEARIGLVRGQKAT